MALIAGIYSSIYARRPANKTAGLVAKARKAKAKRNSRKAGGK